MRISAFDLIGEYHLKLFALENYFTELAEIGLHQSSVDYLEEKAATARSLDHLRRFRLEFEALRQKHREPIERTLAGERPSIELNSHEATLVEAIAEMHAQIWENRRRRHAASP